VTIIKVVVYGRLSMYVEALYCAEMDAFFWNCMTSCMFPRVCECSIRCSAYLEVWLLCMNECFCSLNPDLKSLPLCPKYAFHNLGRSVHRTLTVRKCPCCGILN